MSSRELIFYYAGGGTLFLLCIAVSYWAVNFFIQQVTARTCQRFRESMMSEAERALQIFREGLCEQIVQQENKSDSLAKLYSILIDLLRVGKEFTSRLAGGELLPAEKMLRTIRSTGETFAEVYQKESLHFTDDFCTVLKGLTTQQMSVLQRLEAGWSELQPDNSSRISEMKQDWLQFEDRIGKVMDVMRNEFRKRQPAGNVMMRWLNETPVSRE